MFRAVPVDIGKSWENDIRGEQVVGICEEARCCDNVDQPVETRIVDVLEEVLARPCRVLVAC